jgi:hypothetical protein
MERNLDFIKEGKIVKGSEPLNAKELLEEQQKRDFVSARRFQAIKTDEEILDQKQSRKAA